MASKISEDVKMKIEEVFEVFSHDGNVVKTSELGK